MSTAQTRAKTKYNAKNYDQVNIDVKKGGKAYIKDVAKQSGKSMAMYIKELIIADVAAKHGQEAARQARDALVPNTADKSPSEDSSSPS